MAGVKSNRPKAKARLALRPKKGARTESQKNHTYQSFSQKIADIKIDQAVRINRNVEDEDVESFLRLALDKWIDSNLTTTFTEFTREILPRTDSLPHILHYQDEIADTLLRYIEKGDPLALEPLLDLLVQFARDINANFEKYFSQTFSAISTLIGRNTDVQVWEWAFNCLGYLFKYLSRVLVKDLRPIYAQIAPLLGKEKQKPYIVRFAAEAASFLLRKAKTGVVRDLFREICEDVETIVDGDFLPQYMDGIALMCTEACSGVNNGVHSKGTTIFEEMLRTSINDNGFSKTWSKVVESTLIGLIHHCTKETFTVFEDLIVSYNEGLVERNVGATGLVWAGRLIYIFCAVRKGSRISNWDRIGQHLLKLLDGLKGQSGSVSELSSIIKAASAFAKYADFDALISRFPRIADSFLRASFNSEFLTVIDMTSKGDSAKLDHVVMSHFQKFMNSKWKENEEQLALVLSDLKELRSEDQKETALVPGCQEWAKSILERLDKWTKDVASDTSGNDEHVARLWKCLVVLNSVEIPDQLSKGYARQTGALFKTLSGLCGSVGPEKVYPLLGQVMEFSAPRLDIDKQTIETLVQIVPKGVRNVSFLRGFLHLVESKGSSSSAIKLLLKNKECSSALVKALSSSNPQLRLSSLQVIENILRLNNDPRAEYLKRMEEIEKMPLTVSSSREISVMVRKLASSYETVHKDELLSVAITSFLFGLMTKRFAPIWEDAESALVEVATHNDEPVAEIAYSWLLMPNTSGGEADEEDEDEDEGLNSVFFCTNLNGLEAISEKCIQRNIAPLAEIVKQYHKECSPLPEMHLLKPQALRILAACPQVAERRSKIIVPILLDNWRTDVEEDVPATSAVRSAVLLKRPEKRSLLTVFSKFTNPRGLYKQDEVRAVYMRCLTSGDEEVQKLALKCLLTWKDAYLVPYKDNLSNLLEESRLREELTVFLQPSDEESFVRPDHRQALMLVLLRILYGKAVSRKGSASSKRGVEARRSTILKTIAGLSMEEQKAFVDIMLEDLPDSSFIDKSNPTEFTINSEQINLASILPKKLAGFLRMAEDFLKEMGSHIKDLLVRIVDAVLFCLLQGMGKTGKVVDAAIMKTLRQGSLKCLSVAFDYCPGYQWSPYMGIIFAVGVNDNVSNLPTSNSQAPSGLLQLFETWASHKETVKYLVDYNSGVIPAIANCIVATAVRDGVVIYVLNILSKIVELAPDILQASYDDTVLKLGSVVRGSPHKEVFEKAIDTISALAALSTRTAVSVNMLELCSFLLDQPTRRVHPRIKQSLLRIVYHFITSSDIKAGEELFEKIYLQISTLFGYFLDRESRIVISDAFSALAEKDTSLSDISVLLKDLNAFSTKRLDEPDFEKRLAAFAAVNDRRYSELTVRQWRPLLFNMLFYVKDQEELPIRTSASYSLRRFIDACKIHQKEDASNGYFALLEEIVLPALYNGTRERSELIRMEIVGVMSHLVSELPEWEQTKDIHCLLEDGDEEASFFLNVLHIQQHRRARATRRLGNHAQKTIFSPSNASKFLLPLMEHFIFEAADDAHNLATDAIFAVGSLVKSLNWTQLRAIIKRYVDGLFAKESNAKTIVRLLAAVVDTLSAACARRKPVEGPEETQEYAQDEETKPVDVDVDAEGDVVMEPKAAWNLDATLPSAAKFTSEIKQTLGSLSRFLHDKDEETVSLRVPATVIVVKLLMILPDSEMRKRLPGVLTDICHILRSRSQDSRDMTRKTLAEIAQMLGGAYFSFIVKELRGALLRGYQLHVLSFSLHSLLVSLIPKCAPGELDYCLSDMVQIIMDDTFGAVGIEKDAEDYISRMKEVKSSKSYDSMELLARVTTIKHLPLLVHPIADILTENLALKSLKKVDELLRRINVGILSNASLQSLDLLTFCYELIKEGYRTTVVEGDDKEKQITANSNAQRFLVNLKVPRQSAAPVMHSVHRYKLIRFAFDILRSTFQKQDNLMTPENVANFVPVIGDALLSRDEEVLISALRLLTVVIRVPLESIDEGLDVFTKRALQFIKSSPTTNSELAQASLKLLTGIVRERKSVRVKDTTVAYLLTRIRPDLEEPDRQGISFNFVKAVLSRKIVIPEVYEIMDVVATIMVTNQTRSVRELARAVYFHFFMDYPQGKDRLSKQISFLVKNLEYVHASGRTSVLEFIHQLFTKVGDKLIQDILSSFFVPLVMVLINDDSVECKEMAGRLLKEFMERADDERIRTALNLLDTWIAQKERPLLVRASLQIYGIYFDVHGGKSKKLTMSLHGHIKDILKTTEESHWEQLYFALVLWTKILRGYPDLAFSAAASDVWERIVECLAFPHAWIRLLSSQLVGMYFGKAAASESFSLPLKVINDLEISEPQLFAIAWRCSSHLKRPELSDELGLQAVKNLLFIARVFFATKVPHRPAVSDNKDDSESELDADEQAADSKEAGRLAIQWLVNRICSIVRNDKNSKSGVKGRKFGLQWIAAASQLAQPEEMEIVAKSIIMPLYSLVEMPLNEAFMELKTTSQEVLEVIKSRMSPTAYAKVYAEVREEVSQRRIVRKHKRSIQLVADPERAAQKKIKKHDRKKVARKEKNKEHRDRRRGKNL